MSDCSRTILFVGAGVSMQLGLPSWQQLTDEIGRQLGYDPRVFKLLGSDYALAEFYFREKGTIGPLRSWMDTKWHSTDIDISQSKVHQLIAQKGFRKIYTTNFDRWIERAFDCWNVRYHKITNANTIAAAPDTCQHIVKFHGDFDDDESLVLQESAYFQRLSFESPLDILLRSDVLKYRFVFVGYSLNDVNIRYLFHRLSKIWEGASSSDSRPQSVVFMGKPNAVSERLFKSWNLLPQVAKSTDTSADLAEFLEGL